MKTQTSKYTLFILIYITFSLALLQSAQANILQSWFPELFAKHEVGTEHDPQKTLTAPFANPELKAQTRNFSPDNAIALNKPHRNNTDISRWLTDNISRIMTFESTDYLRETQDKAAFFNETGWQQYIKFLTDSKINNAISSPQYGIYTFVDDLPLLLNKGAINDSYKWLYEVNATITYKDPQIRSYEKEAPVNQRLKIKLQVGRYPDANNTHGILIDQWNASILPYE